ncbi:BtrH N-terminal domain-containing protein [Patulibacter brassicae]|uniref:BtrH N-terminal domain-containing protein n=1 Tax=Patulibacter brassicae TaxID=1705717 RepID=A0ABU4VPP5_9ACTN|nr:BtrH N-terminal domain-containing protein [Patulibacter brassicae]MDX8153823.1 BtrH N-terminal domain-containing protein [Patulibacter brassicae]
MNIPAAPSVPRPFPHRRAGHCASGALRDLLEYHRLDYGAGPLSEPMVFGLSGGYGFFYTDQLPGIPFYLVGRVGSMEHDIAAHLGATAHVQSTDDPDEGWQAIKDAIDRGDPPLVWADIAHLEYLRVRMVNTRHAIVICGYDDDHQVAWVADNDRDELQPCSYTSLRRALNSDGFPSPNRSTRFRYQWPKALPDLEDAVRAAAATTSRNMRQDSDTVGGLQGACGLAGVTHFARTFPDWAARFEDTLPQALDLLTVLIVKAGTGGAMFRSLQADYLGQVADTLRDQTVAEAARTATALADQWKALANNTAAHDLAAARETVQRIDYLEHEALRALEALL